MVILRVPNQKMRRLKKQAGFTIIELMVATFVFSIILYGLTYGLLQITNNYYDGIILNRTRDTTNNVINNISQSIESNGDFHLLTSVTEPDGAFVQGFCIGPVEYSYLVGYELASSFDPVNLKSPQVMVANVNASCSQTLPPVQDVSQGNGTGTELMSPNTRLVNLAITEGKPLSDNLAFYKIDIRTVYGQTSDIANEMINPSTLDYYLPTTNAECLGGIGFQFCAASEISTYVTQRQP